MRNPAQRNCNPLNLRIKAPTGEAIANDEQGFCIFPFWEAGWRAGHRQLRLYAKRGLTIKEGIHKHAPPTENPTQKYLDFVCKEMRCNEETPVKDLSVLALAGVMAQWEGAFEKD